MKGENDFAPQLRDAFTRGLGKNALTRGCAVEAEE